MREVHIISNNPFKIRVEDLNLLDVRKKSIFLINKIIKMDFIPDHILYIERAGLLIGNEIAEFLNCKISGISTKRSGTKTKSKLKVIIKNLPRIITHTLRKIEIASNFHKVSSERVVHTTSNLPSKSSKIFVVDDAIDTGYSMKAVIDFLILRGYKKQNIRVGVITTTSNEPYYIPDVSVFKNTICTFPWSADSKEQKKTWDLYEDIKQMIEKEN